MINCHRHIMHRPGLPAIHDADSRELTLVEVHIEHTSHLSGVLHAQSRKCIKLFCCDGLPAEKHSDEFVRPHTAVLHNVTA